jgi:catechol 2,3-dioxygenase-like lactoylglutathione lyase family enzyme
MEMTETLYPVKDLDAAILLYRQVFGFRLLDRQPWGFAMMESRSGQRVGLLLDRWMRGSGEHSPDMMPAPRLAFQTSSIDRQARKLRDAGLEVSEIDGEAGSTRAATFWDADGNAYFLWQESP